MKSRVSEDGRIEIPPELIEAAGLIEGTWIDIAVDGESIVIRKTAHDPFEEAKKQKPEAPSLSDLVQRHKDKQSRAHSEFDQKIQEAGDSDEEHRPEDHPDFWR
ncbi:MAG: AbrB/MazE/SpoVT family DNA-binding domain-containing protein [Planctomycetota bacterium]